MGLSFLTPLFLAGLAVVAVPVIVHLIRRHRGTPLVFPSLMFLRRLPVRSVRRRRIRDWPLLLVRVTALALIAAAFARPVFVDDGDEGGTGDAFRDVVVVLDRSWSMGLGDRWERARSEVEAVLGGLVAPDRVALVHFDGSAVVAVEPTIDPAGVRAVLDTLAPGWGAPRIGVGLQAATGVLEVSDRARREVVLVSDFQRRGWEDGPRDPLPADVTLRARDVGGDAPGVVGVSEVGFRHEFVDGRQRVHPWARLVRSGEGDGGTATAVLRIDGREMASRSAELPTEGAATLEFEPFFLPPEGARGTVEAVRADDRALAPFGFVLSPGEVLTVLVVEGRGGPSPFLRSALAVGGREPLRVVRRPAAQLSPADLAGVQVVLLDDAPLPGGATGAALRDRVRDGGTGLVVVAGPGSSPGSWEAAWDAFLPGRPGAPVERDASRGAALASVDRDHPVFTPFTAAGRGGLGTPRFFRYRSVGPAQATGPDADAAGSPEGLRVLARFDDGSAALLERRVGEGKVLVWTSSLETGWSDLPLHASFVPLVREIVRYAGERGQGGGAVHFRVGQALDRPFLLARAGIEDEASAILVAPGSGRGASLDAAAPRPSLDRPGFYEVRRTVDAEGGGWLFAVNMDPAAADPARIDPDELVLAATASRGDVGAPEGEGTVAATGGAPLGSSATATRSETERRQSAWMFLLAGALLLLLVETLISNRGRAAGSGTPGRAIGR